MEGKRSATSRDYEIFQSRWYLQEIEAALRTGSRGERGGYWLEPAFDGVAASFEQPLIQCVRGRHGYRIQASFEKKERDGWTAAEGRLPLLLFCVVGLAGLTVTNRRYSNPISDLSCSRGITPPRDPV
jgi:hypothetical protein